MYIGRCMLEIITAFISWINIQFADTHARAHALTYIRMQVYMGLSFYCIKLYVCILYFSKVMYHRRVIIFIF